MGVIYQMNVVPGRQRSLVAASLLKAQFERSAYGCKLYCCWCAQDIEANRFWEAMGFVPLAFRAGSRTKRKDASGKAAPRVHIFWQKRIRKGDASSPYWYPSQTNSGAIREDRLVLPIPPGTHWSAAKPIVLPGAEAADSHAALALVDGKDAKDSTALAVHRPKRGKVKAVEAKGLGIVRSGGAVQATAGGLRFADPTPAVVAIEKVEKPKRVRPPKTKNDPKHIAFARELRDRYLEQYNANEIPPRGKYDVTRELRDGRGEGEDGARPLLLQREQRMLPAA